MACNSKLLLNSIAGLAVLFLAAIGRADETVIEADDQRDLRRLTEIWEGNRSEIQSAHVRFRSLLRPVSNNLNREAVLKLLETTDFAKRRIMRACYRRSWDWESRPSNQRGALANFI